MATFEEAHDCFEENSTLIGQPVAGMSSNADMLAWNLNAGLLNLTLALQTDIGELTDALDDMRARLTRIEHAIQQR
jgi:hypothetical protein